MSSLTKLNKVSDKMVRLSRNDKKLYKSSLKINKLIKELKGGNGNNKSLQTNVVNTIKKSLQTIKEKLAILTPQSQNNQKNGQNPQNGNNPQNRNNSHKGNNQHKGNTQMNCNTCMKQRCSNCVNKKLNNRTPISKLLNHGIKSMSPRQNNLQ